MEEVPATDDTVTTPASNETVKPIVHIDTFPRCSTQFSAHFEWLSKMSTTHFHVEMKGEIQRCCNIRAAGWYSSDEVRSKPASRFNLLHDVFIAVTYANNTLYISSERWIHIQ
uniref:Protein ref(2)P n=1 Tax=Lygus hesperus TaxID=30085 RepID=A0A0A9ZCQ1_LYGHE